MAKNQFEHRARNVWERLGQKLQEWIIAAQLERQFTKDEIITLYYNQFDFLNLAVGVKSASKIYFNSTPDSLRIEQAAMLVGMCKNPNYYNPLRESKKERTLGRRNQVFIQMQRNNVLSQEEVDSRPSSRSQDATEEKPAALALARRILNSFLFTRIRKSISRFSEAFNGLRPRVLAFFLAIFPVPIVDSWQ